MHKNPAPWPNTKTINKPMLYVMTISMLCNTHCRVTRIAGAVLCVTKYERASRNMSAAVAVIEFAVLPVLLASALVTKGIVTCLRQPKVKVSKQARAYSASVLTSAPLKITLDWHTVSTLDWHTVSSR